MGGKSTQSTGVRRVLDPVRGSRHLNPRANPLPLPVKCQRLRSNLLVYDGGGGASVRDQMRSVLTSNHNYVGMGCLDLEFRKLADLRITVFQNIQEYLFFRFSQKNLKF